MKRRYLILAILLVPLAAWALVGQHFGARVAATHTIDQTGDTSVVVKFNGFTGIDGYTYLDTVNIGAKRAVSWTSPVTVRRISVVATPSSTLLDTLILQPAGASNDTITIDCTPALTRLALVDSLVARINAATAAAFLTAADSGTYVKVTSDVAQIAMAGDARFTLSYGGGTANLNFSAGTSDTTSIKMVCDSMVATANALVTIKDTITAAVDGDTVYTMTGRKGWPIVFKVGPADTTQDTVHVINAQAAASSSYDTTTINLPVHMWENGWNSLNGEVVFPASLTTTKGYGTLDSVWFYLYKTWVTSNTAVIVAADSGTIPRTWQVRLESKADSVFGNGPMYFRIIQMDTATDTSGGRLHNIDWGLTATE